MIDEVHTLIGAGAAEGAIDAANILKPALARGELQVRRLQLSTALHWVLNESWAAFVVFFAVGFPALRLCSALLSPAEFVAHC